MGHYTLTLTYNPMGHYTLSLTYNPMGHYTNRLTYNPMGRYKNRFAYNPMGHYGNSLFLVNPITHVKKVCLNGTIGWFSTDLKFFVTDLKSKMTTANTSFNSTVIDWVRGQQLLFEEPVCN